MAEKKFVLILVEGLNDRREIESIFHTPYFSDFMKQYKLVVRPINGDITADRASTENNIKEKISKEIRAFRKNGVPFSNIRASDIYKIIHVVDLDGVFIPRANIKESDDVKYRYEDEFIKAKNTNDVYSRNKKKSSILRVLIDTAIMDNIPYCCYFVSCNMDHLLSGNNNLQTIEKSSLAERFMLECSHKPECIFDIILKDDIAYRTGYKESWDEVQKETNSLKRHTNLNLYFEEVMNKEDKEL